MDEYESESESESTSESTSENKSESKSESKSGNESGTSVQMKNSLLYVIANAKANANVALSESVTCPDGI